MSGTKKTTLSTATAQKNKKVALNPAFKEMLKNQVVCAVWPYIYHEESKRRYEAAKEAAKGRDFAIAEGDYRAYRIYLPEIATAETVLENLAPKDTIEGMIATQMVSIHMATMQCLHMGATEVESFEYRNEYLKTAARLSKAFASLVDARNHHRGKGKIKQEITVQHINLEGGAQAVIGGKIRSKGRGAKKIREQPYAKKTCDK